MNTPYTPPSLINTSNVKSAPGLTMDDLIETFKAMQNQKPVMQIEYPSRRRRAVVISPEVFQDMVTTGWRGDGIECTDGLPDGARFIRFGHDLPRDLYYFIVEHESFDLISPFEQLPLMCITYSKQR